MMISVFIIMFNMCVCRVSAGGVLSVVAWGAMINVFGILCNEMRAALPP